MDDSALHLMEGAYDVHVHANPGIFVNRDGIIETAAMAKSYGMKGIVYKDLHFPTSPQAKLVMEAVPGIDVIGGISLSGVVGGLNPLAVEATFKTGGKVVWMFTLDSAFQVKQIFAPDYPFPLSHSRNMLVEYEKGGYTILDPETNALKPEAKEIVALCKQYDCVLETSHLSRDEAVAIVKECKNQGVKKVVITHANSPFVPYTPDEQKEFVQMGATIMHCICNYMPSVFSTPESFNDLFQVIREVGPQNIVIGTDFGAMNWPSSPDGILTAISAMLASGFSKEDISLMVAENADRLYGLGC